MGSSSTRGEDVGMTSLLDGQLLLLVVEMVVLWWCNPYQSMGRTSSWVLQLPTGGWGEGRRDTCKEQAKDLGTSHFLNKNSQSDLHLTGFNIIVRIPIFP